MRTVVVRRRKALSMMHRASCRCRAASEREAERYASERRPGRVHTSERRWQGRREQRSDARRPRNTWSSLAHSPPDSPVYQLCGAQHVTWRLVREHAQEGVERQRHERLGCRGGSDGDGVGGARLRGLALQVDVDCTRSAVVHMHARGRTTHCPSPWPPSSWRRWISRGSRSRRGTWSA